MSKLAAIWHKYLFGSKVPWCLTLEKDGKMHVLDYNQAYVQDLRQTYFKDLTTAHTPAELVNMWVERVNYERDPPRLEVVHSEVSDDGTIQMKLDWNDAFIKQLNRLGIEAETEDEAVQLYLERMTRHVSYAEVAPAREAAAEGRRATAKKVPSDTEIEQEIEQMDPQILASLESVLKKRRRKKS